MITVMGFKNDDAIFVLFLIFHVERSPEKHEERRRRGCIIRTMVSMYMIWRTIIFICMVSNITSIVITICSMLSSGRGIIAIISMIRRLFGSRVRYRLVAWFSEPGEIAALAVLLWCRWLFRTIASELREKWRMPL